MQNSVRRNLMTTGRTLAILIALALAGPGHAQEEIALLEQMAAAEKAGDCGKVILLADTLQTKAVDTGTQAIALINRAKCRARPAERAATPDNPRLPAAVVPDLTKSAADYAQADSLYKRNPTLPRGGPEVKAPLYRSMARIQLLYATKASFEAKDFAVAESYTLAALIPGATPTIIGYKLPLFRSLVGQAKLSEARAIGKDMLANAPQIPSEYLIKPDYMSVANEMADSLARAGAFAELDALILRELGRLKARNLPKGNLLGNSPSSSLFATANLNAAYLNGLDKPQTAYDKLARAGLLFRSNQDAAALPLLNEVIAAQPTVRAYALRGFVRTALNDIPGAMRDAEAALRLDPNDVSALAMRGAALAISGKYDAAIPDIERAIASYPELALQHNAFHNLALLYQKTGKTDKIPALQSQLSALEDLMK